MSSKCCFGPAGGNIILETVTIVLASCFFLLLLTIVDAKEAVLETICNLGLIVSCALGIVSVKRANCGEKIKLVLFAPILAVIVFILFIVVSVLAYFEIKNSAEVSNDTEGNDQPNEITMTIVFLCVYLVFGLGTSMAVAVKHFTIYKERRREPENSETISCKCCIGSAGDNIILEIVALVLALSFLLLTFLIRAGGGAALDTLGNIGIVLSCIFGIISVKKANYGDQIKFVLIGPILAVIAFILFFFISLIAGLFLNHLATTLHDQKTDDKQNAFVVIVVFVCSYLVYGLGASLALAIKHFGILKKRRRDLEV